MQLIIKLKSDLCISLGRGFASMIDNDTALDEFGIPYIPSRRLKGCLRELAGYYFADENRINEIFGVQGSNQPGTLKIYDAHIRDYNTILEELQILKNDFPEQKDGFSAEEVAGLFCSVRGETEIENGTASDKSLRTVRVVNMHSPIDGKELEFAADIDFNEADKEYIKILVGSLRNIGYHRNRGLGAVECKLEDGSSKSNANYVSFDNADGICLTVHLESDLMLPDMDSNNSSDYIPGSMLLGAVAAEYVRHYSNTDFNRYFYSDVIFGNLYPAIMCYNNVKNEYFYNYTTPAPRFFAKDKNTGEIFNCLGNDTKDRRKKVLKNVYMTFDFAYIIPETKIAYHNANIASEQQLLYMQHCLASGQYYSGEIRGPKDKIKRIAELLGVSELYFGRSKNAQYSRCTICELVPFIDSGKTITQNKTSAFVLESDVCLMKNGVETVDIKELCSVLGVDPDKLLPETSIATKTISGYNAKWNLKKPQFPVFSAGSCLVFDANALDYGTALEYRHIGARQNEGYGRIRLISDVGTLDATKDTCGTAPTDLKSNVISSLVEEQRNMNLVLELSIKNYKGISLNCSQVGRLLLMAKDAGRCKGGEYDDFKKRIESIKKDPVREESKKRFGNLEGLFKETKIPSEWKYIYKYIVVSLTLKKFQLREEGKRNE